MDKRMWQELECEVELQRGRKRARMHDPMEEKTQVENCDCPLEDPQPFAADEEPDNGASSWHGGIEYFYCSWLQVWWAWEDRTFWSEDLGWGQW